MCGGLQVYFLFDKDLNLQNPFFVMYINIPEFHEISEIFDAKLNGVEKKKFS